MSIWNLILTLFTVSISVYAMDVVLYPYKYLSYDEINVYSYPAQIKEECPCECEDYLPYDEY